MSWCSDAPEDETISLFTGLLANPDMTLSLVEIPIDSGMGLSITIDKLRVFVNKTLSTQSLINKLLIKRVGLSISIDSR
jgi:hypothetical protein